MKHIYLSNKMLCNIVGDFIIVPTGFGKSKLVGVKAYTFEPVVEDK